jgi:hypothetical protein
MANRLETILNSYSVHMHKLCVIFEAVGSFVYLSQGNTAVKKVTIYPYNEDTGNYELWDKVGRGVGNLKSLTTLCITPSEGNGAPEPDWEILARVLQHVVSHAITLELQCGHIRGTEEMRAFAGAIQGHPAITRFDTTGSFHFKTTDILCSALATLPHLEDATLWHRQVGGKHVPELGRPESMTEFLRAPSLRSVEFNCFCFTDALCEATANALKEGAAITVETTDRYEVHCVI